MWREEALAAWEEKAKISEKALDKVSANLDAERPKVKATQKEYLNKMEHSLGLNKMLGEKKVKLNGRERDLGSCKAVSVEAQSRGLNPRDNHEELMEFVEL
jgi:hypothetical protein